MTPLPNEASIDTIVFMAHQNSKTPALPENIIEIKIELAAKAYAITTADLKTQSREQLVVTIRQILMYVLRYKYGQRCAKISRAFKRDHTTVLHACHQYTEHTKAKDFYFLDVYNQLEKAGAL